MKRIIEISTPGTGLAVRNGLLHIVPPGTPGADVPLDDIGSILFSESAVTLSGAVVASLAERCVPIIHCAKNYLPSAVTWPVCAGEGVCQTFERQMLLSKPLQKQLWQQLVQAKLNGQADVLRHLGREEAAGEVAAMAGRVRSGDPGNVEARAAARFWRAVALFERRDRKAADANGLFNYAYAIVYAGIARALSAAGLSPHIGLKHRSARNPFCLASDVMEPYRFLGDLAAVDAAKDFEAAGLSPVVKKAVIASVCARPFRLGGVRHTFAQASFLTASSLKTSILTGEDVLLLPEGLVREPA